MHFSSSVLKIVFTFQGGGLTKSPLWARNVAEYNLAPSGSKIYDFRSNNNFYEFLPETPQVSTARQRREAGAADASVRFAVLPHQPSTVDPALRQQIFQNSSLPVQNDLLKPTLAGAQKENPAPSGAQFANDEVEDYEEDGGELGYNLPLHEFQPGSAWYDPNQGGYYQLPQNYPSPDPVMQNAFTRSITLLNWPITISQLPRMKLCALSKKMNGCAKRFSSSQCCRISRSLARLLSLACRMLPRCLLGQLAFKQLRPQHRPF